MRGAMKPGSRAMLVEELVADPPKPTRGTWLDPHMLIMTGGRERTAAEYGELYADAGLELEKTVSTPSPHSIIIGRRWRRHNGNAGILSSSGRTRSSVDLFGCSVRRFCDLLRPDQLPDGRHRTHVSWQGQRHESQRNRRHDTKGSTAGRGDEPGVAQSNKAMIVFALSTAPARTLALLQSQPIERANGNSPDFA